LWAGAAVGVSHIVQSTKAGAEFGFTLIGLLIVANIVKYPFFEFAPRYVSATGENLIQGYARVGKWAVALYGILTILTMLTIQSAVTIVTASLIGYIFDLPFSLFEISIGILFIITIIVSIGRYDLIDIIIKFIILSLTVSTLIAVGSVFDFNSISFGEVDFSNPIHIAFLIAFVGWMPAPIDIAVWHSLWSSAKEKESGKRIPLKEALLDFNIGYIGTVVIAIGFLILGAFLMYGSGEAISPKGTVFASQLVSLYTESIGDWAYPVIAVASITTMFSTTLMCLDAYGRIFKPTFKILFPKVEKVDLLNKLWIFSIVIGSLVVIGYFVKSMGFLVDVATTLSFVTAPFLAFLNYKVITHHSISQEFQPPLWLRIHAKIGLILLVLFSLYFIYFDNF
jgi:Mn2+/Fe2+ NRAMP family transporter